MTAEIELTRIYLIFPRHRCDSTSSLNFPCWCYFLDHHNREKLKIHANMKIVLLRHWLHTSRL